MNSRLKRTERAIQTIRDQAELLPHETADALQDIVDVIRTIVILPLAASIWT